MPGSWRGAFAAGAAVSSLNVVTGCKAGKIGQIQEIAEAYGSILLYINI